VKGLNVTRMDLNAPAAAPQNGAVPQMAAFHVVEHIDRPATLFAHAAARAADSAHLWISVPSDRRPTRRFGVRDFLDQPRTTLLDGHRMRSERSGGNTVGSSPK
jgi:hypothetical protein